MVHDSGEMESNMKAQHPIARAFSASLVTVVPVMAGYLVMGSAYGVLMYSIGYGPGWTAVMSALVLGGTIQFIATGLLAAGYQPLYALIISVTVNARHLFYGVSMLERYTGTGWKKPFLVFWLTDETFSLLCSGEIPEGADREWFWFFVSFLGYFYWILGGLIGNVAGSLLAFDTKGADFAMTALFLVIIINQWRSVRNHLPAMIGVAASVVSLLAFGAKYFIIPSMALISISLIACRKRMEGGAQDAGEGCP